MATLIRYVNTVPHTSGDGTTNGTGNAGTNSFVSLAAAVAALAQTLTGVTCDVADIDGNLTIALDIICTGSTTDGGGQALFSSASWVTDATHRVRVRCDQICGPKWDTTKYHLSTANGFTGSIQVTTPINIVWQDLQAENTATLDNSPMAIRSDAQVVTDHDFVRGFYRITSVTGTPGSPNGMDVQDIPAGAKLRMRNVTATSNGPGSAAAIVGSDTCWIYDCTFIDRDGGGTSTAFTFTKGTTNTCRLKNLLIQGSGLNYQVANQLPTQAVTILTKDTSSPTTALRSKTVTFVNAASYDYHEASSDPSVGVGTDLSADAFMPVTTDGDNVVRVAPSDVGSDQYTAAPPPTATPTSSSRRIGYTW